MPDARSRRDVVTNNIGREVMIAQTAYGALIRAAREMAQCGTFGFVEDAVPFAELNAMFPGTSR